MKKLLTVIAAGAICATSAVGKTYQTKAYGLMRTDDVHNVTVGPGTVETKTVLHFSTSGGQTPNTTANITYLTVDLTNPYVTPKVAFADTRKIQDVFLTVPQMMSKYTSYANHYFAGVNGDFFGYITCGVTVADGTYVYAGNYLNDKNPFEGNHFIIDKDGLPYIADHIEFGCNLGIRNGIAGPNSTLGEVTFPDGAKFDGVHLNGNRDANSIVLYSPYVNNTSTHANEWGSEAELIKRRNGNHTLFGGEAEFEVGKFTTNGVGGNMAIPENGYVLSGHGERKFDGKVTTGSRVKLSIPFKADGVPNSCRETLGAWPRLVTEGTPLSSVPAKTPGDLGGEARRARTAVGFSKDRKTLYIVVVEENSSATNGMTFKALGNFMEAIGCYHAVALDGGGSSVMHVENLGQRSLVQGSKTYNRPVMNGLFLVTNAPEDRTVASIEFVDKSLTIQPGKGYVPTIYGYNKYGVLICTNITNYTLTAPQATFNSGSRKMIAPQSGSFTLTAHYNGLTATLPVTVSSSGVSGVSTAATTFAAEKMTPIPPKPADWVESSIYVAGNFNGWKPNEPLIVNPVEGSSDIYEFEADYKEPIAFKFTTLDPRDNGGWEAFKAGNNGVGFSWHVDNDHIILAPGKEAPLVPGNAGNITTPWAGKFRIRIDLSKETITVNTSTPRPALEAPEHLYLIGTMEGHTWDVAYTGTELKGKDGVFTLKNVELTGTDAYFAFTTKADADKEVVNSYPRYGGWKAYERIEDEDYFFESLNSWKVDPGEYDITVDFNTGKVKVEPVVKPIYAVLEDITPAGYDWDNYDVGPFDARQIPSEIGGTWWTAPAGTFSQDWMDKYGQLISIHQRGGTSATNTDELFADLQNGLSIQDLGGHIGKVLVYNQEYGPGANVHHWPNSVKAPITQISFYIDDNYRQKGGVDKAMRVRLVFQLLHRGRHNQNCVQIPTIYACAANSTTSWPFTHNGVGDDAVGNQFPITGKDFYRWENEGQTIAEMPEEKVLLDGKGTPEPWDNDIDTNPYLINGERFMVYEWDIHSDHSGPTGIHFTIAAPDTKAPDNRYNTYIFKEIKFFNILNGEEVATQPRAGAPRRVPAMTTSFTNNTASGSLAGTRHISYRYYTADGVKEFDTQPDSPTSGVEEVIAGRDDEDAPVEYYNLQGIRVSNPANGIYIRRQGNKVSRILVK